MLIIHRRRVKRPTRCTIFLNNLFQLNYPRHVSSKQLFIIIRCSVQAAYSILPCIFMRSLVAEMIRMILSVTWRFALDGFNVYILSPTTELLCLIDYGTRRTALIWVYVFTYKWLYLTDGLRPNRQDGLYVPLNWRSSYYLHKMATFP